MYNDQNMTEPSGITCPKCGAANMWDNRLTKRNPKAPDYKCRKRECDGVVWPPKGDAKAEKAPYVQQDRGSLPNDDGPSAYAEAPASVKSTQMYLDAMKFVVEKVVPVWEAGKVPYTAADINAATATVMIDHQRRSGR